MQRCVVIAVVTYSGFQMTVENSLLESLLLPIAAGANSAMNLSGFLAITCHLLKAREKSHGQDAIGFGFASHWLKN